MNNYLPYSRHMAGVLRDLATIGERGRGAAAARFLEPDNIPRVACDHCFGRNAHTIAADGTRRPFDNADFDPAKGDRYCGSCPVCRGFKTIEVTQEEYDLRAAALVTLQRLRYRALRKAVCKASQIDHARFDRLAGKRVPEGTKAPREWLKAAELVATDFGVKP